MPDIDLSVILADGEYLKREGNNLVGDTPDSGGVDAEAAVDAVAAALVPGNNIDVTYNDAAGTITVAVEPLTATDVGLDQVDNTSDDQKPLFSTTTATPGLVPGSNGVAATRYLDAAGGWTVPEAAGTTTPGAAPSIVATTFTPAAETGGTSATITLTTPTGSAIGDYLLAVLGCQSSVAVADFTTPAGWTRVGLAFAPPNPQIRVLGFFLHKLAVDASPTYTFTGYTGGQRQGGMLVLLQDVHPTDPVSVASSAYGAKLVAPNNNTVRVGALTSPSEDSLYLVAAMSQVTVGDAGTITTPPTGMTLVQDMTIGLSSASRTRLTLYRQAVGAEAVTAKDVVYAAVPVDAVSSGLVLRGTPEGTGGGGGPVGPIEVADITDMTAIGADVATAPTLSAAQEAVGIITIDEGDPIPVGIPAGTIVIVVPA